MKNMLENLGKWPLPGGDARKAGRMVFIPRERWLRVIHGRDNHILVSFFVSNDFCHFGKMQIPPSSHSDPETHKGDEVLFLLNGKLNIQVYGANESEATVLHETFEVKEGAQFLIPEGVRHRYLNFTDETVEAVFGIAPGL